MKRLPAPIDNGFACRRQIIKPQKISTRVVDGLELLAHAEGNDVAYLLAQGCSVAEISRRLRRDYDNVWREAKKLLPRALSVTAVRGSTPDASAFEVIELFAEVQSMLPEHLRR